MQRKMTIQDVDQVMEIERASFTLPWSKESYAGELKNCFAHYLVLDVSGIVAAYGGIWVVFEQAHLTNIAVHVDYRQRGMGSALMQALEQTARKNKAEYVYLEVRPSNLAAVNMYASLGYGISGARTAYYTDNGEDAYIMSKLLF